MIHSLHSIGSTHKQNEDSLYYYDGTEFLYMFISDGCSGGEDSVFASYLFKKIIKDIVSDSYCQSNIGSTNDKANYVMKELFSDVKMYKKLLKLSINELEATIGLSVIRKSDNEATVVFSGDGVYAIDDNIVNIEQGNAPKYMAHYNDFTEFKSTLTQVSVNFKEQIAISSDGLLSFKTNTDKLDMTELFINNKWNNNHPKCLIKKLRLLKLGKFSTYYEKMVNKDDISLLIYTKD